MNAGTPVSNTVLLAGCAVMMALAMTIPWTLHLILGALVELWRMIFGQGRG